MNIQLFNHPVFGEIRTTGTPEYPLFCILDVCRALDLRPDKAVAKLRKVSAKITSIGDDDTKGMERGMTPKKGDPSQDDSEITPQKGDQSLQNSDCPMLFKYLLPDAMGRDRETYFVDEPGLYRVIFISEKPEALRFQEWVFREVIPAIRKQGGYMAQEAQKQLTETAVKAILGLLPDIVQGFIPDMVRDQCNKFLTEQSLPMLCDQIPDVREITDDGMMFEMLAKVQEIRGVRYTASTLAKQYSMDVNDFNRILKDAGIQYRQGGRWHIAPEYSDRGLTDTAALAVRTKGGNLIQRPDAMVWTEKGRWFIFLLFFRQGWLCKLTNPIR